MGFTMTAAEVIAFLVAHGYHEEGGGKHLKMVKGGHRVPVPKHPGDMRKGTVNKILSLAGFTQNDVMEWRNGE
jgi:predicted RNA binding protein YcfA (HicA-like mRNA interferase family)